MFVLHYGLFQTQRKISMLQSELGPSDFALFFFFQSCPWCLASGLCQVLFSVPGIYVEIYVYDDVYVRLPMTSYLRQMSHHVRQPHIRSSKSDFFPSKIHEKILFSKVRLIPDSARSDISKEPIKSEYLCKNANKRNSVTTGPTRQVHFISREKKERNKTSWLQ